jgi:hypothetical protein
VEIYGLDTTVCGFHGARAVPGLVEQLMGAKVAQASGPGTRGNTCGCGTVVATYSALAFDQLTTDKIT